MIIETSTLKAEVKNIEELKRKTKRTPVSDRLAKGFGFKASDCAIWNGALFIYNQANNCVLVIDYFSKGERKFYDFNLC